LNRITPSGGDGVIILAGFGLSRLKPLLHIA